MSIIPYFSEFRLQLNKYINLKMSSQPYDLVIDDHLNSTSSENNISKLNDNQVVQLYRKKIERKRDPATTQRDNKYKVSRDYEVVFVRENKPLVFGRGKRLFAVLGKMEKRRLAVGFQKIQEFFRNTLWMIKEQTICVDDIKLPIDLKKAEEGLSNISDVWNRKIQLLVISGFMKISYQQKEVIKKREELETALKNMRIEHVFSILKDFTVRKRTKGIQADLVTDQSVIQKVDSVATMHDSFFSKSKPRTFRNPFLKLKDEKGEGEGEVVSVKLDDSKLSEPTSFHTINLKMGKLESVLKEARKIRERNELTKRYSARLPGVGDREREEEDEKREVSINDQVHHSCLDIKGSFMDNWRENNKTKINQDNDQQERGRIYSKRSDTETYKNTLFNTLPNQQLHNNDKTKRFSSVTGNNKQQTRNQSKSKTIIHQIIQPVIQQVIQPIHYHHISYDSYSRQYQNYYQNQARSSRFSQPQPVLEHREYRPVQGYKVEKSPYFSRVYAGTPKYKNKIWS